MGFAARLALLLIAVLSTSAIARADDLSSLLQRMRERTGPVWNAHLLSTSVLTLDGEPAEMHTETHNLRFATYQCTDNLCVGSYFDGERLYDIDINGTTLPQSDMNDVFLRGERTIASFAFLDPAFADDGGRVSDDGLVTITGSRYRELVVSNGDATPMQVFVDPVTAQVRYFRDINGDSSFEYRDYRSVNGGYTLPFEVLRNGVVIENYHTRASTRDEFHPPEGPKPVFHGAPVPVVTDIDHTVPMFACSLGGVKTKCLLDSGNSGLSISRELAAQIHAETMGSFIVRGLGNYSTEVVRGGNLQVGNATYPAANYVVLNDIHQFGYDVVLGADFLASTTIALDPVAHTVTLGAAAPQNADGVHISFENFLPVVQVQLGKLGTPLALDTGDETNINLAFDYYRAHRDLFSATEQRTIFGIGGDSVEIMGTIPSVRIGDLSLSQQHIGATPRLHSTAYGHLGASFLAQFNVLFDYAGGMVYFTPIEVDN